MKDFPKEKKSQLSPEAEWIMLNRKQSPLLQRMRSTYEEKRGESIAEGLMRTPFDDIAMPERKRGLMSILMQFFSL